MRVFKYEIPVDDHFHIVPKGAVVLVAWEYSDTVLIWIELTETDAEDLKAGLRIHDLPEVQQLRVYGTGHRVPDHLHHVGSVREPLSPTDDHLPLVWHVYSEETIE